MGIAHTESDSREEVSARLVPEVLSSCSGVKRLEYSSITSTCEGRRGLSCFLCSLSHRRWGAETAVG